MNRYLNSTGDGRHLDGGVTLKPLTKSDMAGIHLLGSFMQAEREQRPFIIRRIVIIASRGSSGSTASGSSRNGHV